MNRLRLALCAFAVGLMLTLTASATAADRSPISDCQAHGGSLSRTFPVPALEAALRSIPASVREYTTCYTAIQNQLNTELGATGTPVGSVAGAGATGGGSGTVILIVLVVVVLGVGGAAATWAYRRNASS